MKYENLNGIFKLNAVTSLNLSAILRGFILIFCMNFSITVAISQCSNPPSTETCIGSFSVTPLATPIELSTLACDGVDVLTMQVQSGEAYNVNLVDDKSYTFELCPTGNNSTSPIFSGVMDLTYLMSSLTTTGTIGASPDCVSMSYTASGVPNPVVLSIWDKNCNGSWLDYELTIECTECAITCGELQTVAANESGCTSNEVTFPVPTRTGPCDNALFIAEDDGSGATIDGDMVVIPAGTIADIYDVEFRTVTCSGQQIACTQRFVVEPTPACSSPNITLSQFCNTEISAGTILNPLCTDEHQFTVIVNGSTNNVITTAGTYNVEVLYTPTVDGTEDGAPNTSNPFYNKSLCWNSITVEDKSGPICTLDSEDTEYNFVCGFETTTAIPTFTDCSGTVTANDVVSLSIGDCGDISGLTDGDADLLNDFSAGVLTFMGMEIPEPSEADAATLSEAGFALERIIKNSFSATDGMNTGSACDQYIYIWRPTSIEDPKSALITCGLETTPAALAAIDPQLVPYYVNPVYNSGNDNSTANDFSADDIQEATFASTRVDDNGNPEFVAIAGQDHSVCKFTVANEDSAIVNPCGNTTKFVRRYTVLNCCTNEIVLDDFAQYVETIDNVAPEFTNCPTGTVLGTITNPDTARITSSNSCSASFDFTSIGLIATDACSEPVTYNSNYFLLADDFSGAGTLAASGMNPSLEKGSYRLEVTAEDDCGNFSAPCNYYLIVIDDVVPSLTCSVNAVSVDGNGNAEVCASDFATASDNCTTISNLEVRLMEQAVTTFDDCITVNCEDAVADANGMLVFNLVFRATDACGNTNISMCSAELQVKATPQFTCPANTIVECSAYSPADNYGDPTVAGECGQMFTTSYVDAAGSNSCAGTGTIIRTFTLSMNNAVVATCDQTITLDDTIAPTFDNAPADETVECDNIPDGSGVTASDECSSATVATPTDVITDGACTDSYTITRTFTATDECGNSAIHIQTITVEDTTAPVFTDTPADASVACGNIPPVQPATATDNCDNDVTITTQDGDPTEMDCPENNSFIRTYTATDNCGNTAIYEQTITLLYVPAMVTFATPNDITLDCDEMDDFTFTPPTITESPCGESNIVVSAVVIETAPVNADGDIVVTGTYTVTNDCGLSVSGTTTVTFTDCCPALTIQNDVFNCSLLSGIITIDPFTTYGGNMNDLTFSLFDSNGTQIGIDQVGDDSFTFNGDPSDGLEYTVSVRFTDPAISANCPGAQTLPASCNVNRIAGRIFNEEFVFVEDVEVELMNTEIPMSITNEAGEFNFDGLSDQAYSVIAHKFEHPMNGISTYDLVVMAQHVLGVTPLDSPYKLIAADINMDKTIDILDMLELRQLILFSINDFTINSSWRFVNADYIFPDATNPWLETIPEIHNLNTLTADTDVDFIAVKIGDLDCSAETSNNANNVAPREHQTLVLEAKEKTAKAGSTFEITLQPNMDVDISALQFTLDFDPSMASLVSMESTALQLKDGAINEKFASEGLIPFVWYQSQDVSFQSDQTLSLIFEAKQDVKVSELLDLRSTLTKAAAFTSAGLAYDVSFQVVDDSSFAGNDKYTLYQNQPNPFQTETVIGFDVATSEEVTLTVFDIDGKLLYKTAFKAEAGYNKVELSKADLQKTGVLFYQLDAADYSMTKKMIILE